MIEVKSHRESDEACESIIFASAKFRVIVCKGNTQWIIQTRHGKNCRGSAWRSVSYCCTRKALIREWHFKTGDYHGAVVLGQLPERIGGKL